MGRRDLTRPKSEEDDTNTGPPVAVSPEMENMGFSNYPYFEKYFNAYRRNWEELNNFYVRSGVLQEQRIGMEIVHDIVDEGMKFEYIENVFSIPLIKEQFEEILNVKTLDYKSPSWTRSTLYNDKVIEWAKEKVCVYADSVLCLGKVEQDPGATHASWTRQIEDLKRFPTYQDAGQERT